MATKKNITVNGVLTPVWQTDATAQQIDDAVVAAQNAVLYTAQSLTDAQKTQARGNINAAPGGFGWGEELPRQVSTAAEVDAITANSVVRYANTSTNLVGGDSGSYTRYAIVVTYTVNATDKAQDVYCYGGGAHGDVMLHRGRSGNTWLPWEWPNPPMQLGVEYRTTERYLGKPIYCKVVDCGNLPNAGRKTVSIGVSGLEKVIDVSGCAIDASNNDFYSIPVTDFNSSVHNVGLYATGSQTIVMTTQSDRSMYNAYVKVRYTKTTD